MPLHPLAAGFAAVADSYERGRSDFPPAAAGAIAAELGLRPGARVLDLAAGTGKLTRALVGVGLDVTAVEPLRELRGILAGAVGPERVVEGVAEDIPLDDASVDAVTVANAFHWFDGPAALAEIGRVLRPGGGLALVATLPDWRGASWAHELGALIGSLRPAHPGFDRPPWQELVRDTPGWRAPREIRVSVAEPAGLDRVVDYVGSISWMAGLPDEQRAAALGRARQIVGAGDTPDELHATFVIGLTARG